MRIGLVIYGTLETLSGGYLYDRKLVDYLRSQGDQVEIVSLPWRNYRRHLGDNWDRAFAQRLRDLSVDLLLQDELNHPSLFLRNGWLRGQVDYRFVSIVHHLRISEAWRPPLRSLFHLVERRYLQSVDGFLCNSATTQATVAALRGEALDRDSAFPNLIAFPAGDHLQPLPANQVVAQVHKRATQAGPLRILFVGNVLMRKGLHTLLLALAKVDRRDFRLDVVGNLTLEPATTQLVFTLIKRLGLSETVHLHGVVGVDRLRQHYKESHLLAVPSYEGFGIVYLEAMSFGLPVIATTAGAAHEVVTPGENGVLVEPNDVDGLAAQLAALAADRTQLQTMSLAARQRYDAHPTWAQSMATVHQWLHEVWA